MRYQGNTDVKERRYSQYSVQRDKERFVLKEREESSCHIGRHSSSLTVSSVVVSLCWCYWTLLEAGVSQPSRQTARLDLTDEDSLPPPALQLQPQLQAVGAGSDLDVVDLHSRLVGCVDINVHRGPGAGRAALTGEAGEGDDSFSERFPSTCPDDSLSHHVTLQFSL